MCVMSMVHDHFGPRFPGLPNEWLNGGLTIPATVVEPTGVAPVDLFGNAAAIAELRKLIAEFREAVEAARKVDLLTNQPDCVDPEKAKLEERVAALEKALDRLSKPKRKRARK